MKKTRIVLVLVFAILFSLTACSKNKEGTGSNGSKDQNNRDKTLVLWSIVTESDGFRNAYNQAIKDYENAHTDIKIIHESFGNEEYKAKIQTAMEKDELPDIFYTWGGGFSSSFVESGRVQGLDSFFKEEYKEQLPQIALANATYDGKLYGSTYTTPVSALFYNKRMFDDNDLKVPETWEELVAVCRTFLDQGIIPFGMSVTDSWALTMLHDGLALKSAGPSKTYDVLTKKEGSYNDPAFLNAAFKMMELINMGVFLDYPSDISNDQASEQFYKGSVPMYVSGSWMAGSIMEKAEDPDDFAAAPIPVINENNAKLTDFMGGAADTLMVSASSKNIDIAGDAVFELCRSISKYSYLEGQGIAAWKVDYDDSDVNTIMKQLTEYTSYATSFTQWFDTLMETDDASEYLALLKQLFSRKITPKKFITSMASKLE